MPIKGYLDFHRQHYPPLIIFDPMVLRRFLWVSLSVFVCDHVGGLKNRKRRDSPHN